MRPYTFKVAAGTEEPAFFGHANYVKLSKTATVNVTIKDPDGNQEHILRPGGDVLLRPFDELRFSHDGASDTAFTVNVGFDTKATDAEISGAVQPVGGADNLANPPYVQLLSAGPANGDHHLGGYFQPAVSAQRSWVQLFNPAASGKTLEVYRACGGGYGASSQVNLKSHNAALGTLLSGTTGAKNKLINGALGVGQVRIGSGGTTGNYLTGAHSGVDKLQEYVDPDSPIILPEGWGLHFETQLVNIAIHGFFEWREY